MDFTTDIKNTIKTRLDVLVDEKERLEAALEKLNGEPSKVSHLHVAREEKADTKKKQTRSKKRADVQKAMLAALEEGPKPKPLLFKGIGGYRSSKDRAFNRLKQNNKITIDTVEGIEMVSLTKDRAQIVA